MQKERIFHYIKQAVDKLVEQNKFDTGDEFRLTQREALRAYAQDLTDEKLTLDEKLTGFFEIPTGIGKTALFLSIIGNAYRAAKANDEEFKAAVVVPLTTLLNDTRDEDAKRFIPDLMHEIGLYGDRHHTLGKPITLLTYPAFDTLTKEGKIGPHNIDLLITDESHRGTSENLTDNVIKIYEEAHTAMLGFTASAEFDDEKSVYNTHKRKIYSKKIGQAVKEGDQLTEYIQTQNFVIRVAPKDEEELKDIFGDAVADSDYQTRMKQAAWNKAMVQHLRDGRDERTKDPLTDNQGAFYTQDTTHANALGKALNQDPVLQQRAAAQGYKGVAAVVHTNGIPEKERKRLIKEYKAGKYMTLVGDSMFKEGFNHPPMKTVFDYMRGSLVDKVQVLGRGARRWWNEKKERYEGLTFIDSIVYVGSDDPEEDALYEARARRHAVLASKVMDGEAYALSPKEQEKEKRLHASGKLGGRAKVIFPDDDNIKEYVDLEDLQTFAREQEEFEKDRFEGYEPISEEDFLFLQSEAERTGLGGEAVFAKIDTPPKGMSKKR
ncbi:MAG: DEAD/DEAH box helicase family protein, partial [Alphaproteobacteria bacterium]|nr:DEAD/DEAH box helicase family protein [Alphaproteobacteria bacterium]